MCVLLVQREHIKDLLEMEPVRIVRQERIVIKPHLHLVPVAVIVVNTVRQGPHLVVPVVMVKLRTADIPVAKKPLQEVKLAGVVLMGPMVMAGAGYVNPEQEMDVVVTKERNVILLERLAMQIVI